MAKKRNSTLDRRLSFYPHPKYLAIFIAYAHDTLTSKPKMAEFMVKKVIDGMSDSERERLSLLYAKMTPEQRRRTENAEGGKKRVVIKTQKEQ